MRADVKEDDLVRDEFKPKDNAVRIRQPNRMLSLKASTQRMQPQFRIVRIPLKLVKNKREYFLQVAMASKKLSGRSLERVSPDERIGHVRLRSVRSSGRPPSRA
jgi:hypothetical protein